MTDTSLKSLSYAVDCRVVGKYLGLLSLSLAAMAAVPGLVAGGPGGGVAGGRSPA